MRDQSELLQESTVSVEKATQNLRKAGDTSDLSIASTERLSESFQGLNAKQRILLAHKLFGEGLVATTSGGSTSAILMCLLKDLHPEIRIPVVFVDTGHYPTSTYLMIQTFIDYGLDIRIYSARTTPAMQRVLFDEDPAVQAAVSSDLRRQIKHEPLNRAFRELGAKAWLRGVMGHQTEARSKYPLVRHNGAIWQIHPVIDWSEKDAQTFIEQKDLPTNEEHFDITKDTTRECGIGDICGFNPD